MKGRHHFLLSMFFAISSYCQANDPILALACLLLGYLIDTDHVFEYWIDKGRLVKRYEQLFYKKENPLEFYCVFHAFEYIPLVFLASNHLWGINSIFPLLSYALHLVLDASLNGEGKYWKSYFILYRQKRWKKNRMGLLKGVIGVVLLLATLSWVGFESFLASLGSLNIMFFALSLLIYLVLVSIWAFKLHYTINGVGTRVSYSDCWWTNLWAMFGGIFHQSVGLVFEVQATKSLTGLNAYSVSGLILSIQGIEVMARAIVTSFGLLYFSRFGIQTWSLISFLLIAVIGLLPVIFFLIIFFKDNKAIAKTIKFLPAKLQSVIHNVSRDVCLLKNKIIPLFAITFLSIAIRSLEWTALSAAINYPLPFDVCLFLSSSVLFVKLIPIPFSLGVYDLSVAQIFYQLFGIPMSSGAVFAMLDRVNDVFIASFVLTRMGLLKKESNQRLFSNV